MQHSMANSRECTPKDWKCLISAQNKKTESYYNYLYCIRFSYFFMIYPTLSFGGILWIFSIMLQLHPELFHRKYLLPKAIVLPCWLSLKVANDHQDSSRMCRKTQMGHARLGPGVQPTRHGGTAGTDIG